jgi:hypothetical protein
MMATTMTEEPRFCIGCGEVIAGQTAYCSKKCKLRAHYRRTHPLPLMKPSHAPQVGPRPWDKIVQRWHAEDPPYEVPANWPDNNWAYGIWVCTDLEQVMFSRNYMPMWRCYPGKPAVRDDPNRWIDWRMMYFLHDDKPAPEHSKRLRESLLIVMAEFISRGALFIRDWQGRRGIPRWGGELIASAPVRPKLAIVPDNPESERS